MSEKVLPTLLITLLAGCSAIVNPSGAPFAEDGGIRPTDASTDSATRDADVPDVGRRDTGVDSGRGCPEGCDDGVDCTVDSCVDGECRHGLNHASCNDGIACTVDRCSASDDCINTPNDGLCDDGYCFTGARCVVGAGGCTGGAARDCSDPDPCTSDSCDAAALMCVHAPLDEDGDTYPAASVGTGGFPPGGGRSCPGGTDCDDSNPDVHPGATEVCNGRDDNCDGVTDEGCAAPPDNCGSAQQITLSAGRGSASGVLGAVNDDYRTSCGESGGHDAVYYIDVSSMSDITIDTLGSAADTVLSVTLDCPSFGTFGQNACDDDIDTTVVIASRIWLHRVGPSFGASSLRVFILVDGYNSSATEGYQVKVQVDDARADSCSGPIDISGGGTLVGAIQTTGLPFPGGESGSCQGPGESFEAEALATFRGSPGRTAEFDAFARNFVPDIYVRRRCDRSDSEVGCQKGAPAGSGLNRAQLNVDVMSDARYYLYVDGASSSGGYSVDYQP